MDCKGGVQRSAVSLCTVRTCTDLVTLRTVRPLTSSTCLASQARGLHLYCRRTRTHQITLMVPLLHCDKDQIQRPYQIGTEIPLGTLRPNACIPIYLRIPTWTRTMSPKPLLHVFAPVGGDFPAAEQGFTTLTARSSKLSGLLKMLSSTSRYIRLGTFPRIGNVGAPARPPRLRPPRLAHVSLPSISTNASSTISGEKDDGPKGPTRPAAGGANA